MNVFSTLKKRAGQVAIEFILIVVVVFFFLFFFLSLSVLIITSQYIDYATFMAARTFKSMAKSPTSQQTFATEIFNKYFENVRGIARNPVIQFVNPENPKSAGMLVTYDIDLFYLPPIFVKGPMPPSRITLRSEALLGRDASSDECKSYFNSFSQRLGLGIEGTNLADQMEDNGC